MKDLIKSLIPQSIRQSLIGDLYRMLRGRSTSQPDDTVQTYESKPVEDVEPPQHPEPEMEEFEVDIRPRQLRAWVDENQPFDIVDIREPFELQQGYLTNSILIPMNDVPNEHQHLSRKHPVVIVCAAGARSWSVAQYLRNQGMDDVWSLESGWAAWADQGHVSPARGRYSVGTKVSVRAAYLNDIEPKPIVQYGYIHNCLKDGDLVQYDVQLWTENGQIVIKDVPESAVEAFMPSL